MDKKINLLKQYLEDLKKANGHLKYSNNKIQTMSSKIESLDDEDLETWESFAARFARVVDIFLMKYLRLVVKIDDPIFSGTLRDFLNVGAKMKIIDDPDYWLELRSLRNSIAHEYNTENWEKFYNQLKTNVSPLISFIDNLTEKE